MPPRILFQFDPDDQPSSFDSVVAIDAGVDQLLRFSGVTESGVTGLVHGAMFTRGGDDLKSTAIFVGGSDVARAEAIFDAAQKAFFGPVRVSVMLDANGCNTTASAAVVAAARHRPLEGSSAVVLGGTGPVGRRVARLLAGEGAEVCLTSRSDERAAAACDAIRQKHPAASLSHASVASDENARRVLEGAEIVIACGAAGVTLVDESTMAGLPRLAVAIDLNAVPPAGIGGVGAMDKAKPFGSGVAYGAIGVGGLKMRTHRTAISRLFERNDAILDAEEIYAIAKEFS